MSEFFREVDEDYRRERLLLLWRKHRTLIIGAAALFVVGTAAWRLYDYMKNRAAEAAGARYQAAMRLSSDGKGEEARVAFADIAASGPAGYAALARLRLAEADAARDPSAGVSAYDALAADQRLDQSFRDLAQLRAAALRIDLDDPKAFEDRYRSLASPAFMYHGMMSELLALAALRRDDYEAAGRWLDMIVADPQATGALRQRAEAFLGIVQAGKLAPAAPAPAPEFPVVPPAPTLSLPIAPPAPALAAPEAAAPAPAVEPKPETPAQAEPPAPVSEPEAPPPAGEAAPEAPPAPEAAAPAPAPETPAAAPPPDQK
ncbi:tetratricopeptide repeat protein [Methylocella sp.]|uniref:tetratricopeptide repeat protein n=1 Tax=Methylocella sp. TaxID=1978226 RepID=UPI0035B37880